MKRETFLSRVLNGSISVDAPQQWHAAILWRFRSRADLLVSRVLNTCLRVLYCCIVLFVVAKPERFSFYLFICYRRQSSAGFFDVTDIRIEVGGPDWCGAQCWDWKCSFCKDRTVADIWLVRFVCAWVCLCACMIICRFIYWSGM